MFPCRRVSRIGQSWPFIMQGPKHTHNFLNNFLQGDKLIVCCILSILSTNHTWRCLCATNLDLCLVLNAILYHANIYSAKDLCFGASSEWPITFTSTAKSQPMLMWGWIWCCREQELKLLNHDGISYINWATITGLRG